MFETRFIHLTDTHLVAGDGLLYGLDPADRLRAAVDAINEHHAGQAQFVVVTGDLTHWGEPEAYRTLANAFARLPIPVDLLIGNHDDRRVFQTEIPDAMRDPDGFVQGWRDTPAARLVYLDTVLPGTHAGAYCEARRRWLSDTLEAAPGPVMLFMHHPPFEIGIAPMDTICLSDRGPFADVVMPHRDRIRHLFFGHVHRPISGSWRGIPFSTIHGTNHQVALNLDAGVTAIPGSHEPPSYSVVLASRHDVIVHQFPFLDASRTFDMATGYGAEPRDYALSMG